ncbi:MAG: hypothetical protein Ta2F_06980 [Termitinemataceae bacterium]|nr:MAG: hypothetical protein Ta2F_06980 [Termitinemataceae bacterium]
MVVAKTFIAAFVKRTKIFLILFLPFAFFIFCTGCVSTTRLEMAPNVIPKYSILKIVPGTIITDYDGVRLFKAWKGRLWKYKQIVTVRISSGKHTLRAEAEFDPPIWSYPRNPPYEFGKNPKIYVVDKTVPIPLGDPIDNRAKYSIYQGYLTTEFDFEPEHEYVAEVIRDQDDDFLLYIFDSKQYPRREKIDFTAPDSTKRHFLDTLNTPRKGRNRSRII